MAKKPDAAKRNAVEERRENRREEILLAAQELFHRRGYANTSLDDIARAVGIKREGLYYYFPIRVSVSNFSLFNYSKESAFNIIRTIVIVKNLI